MFANVFTKTTSDRLPAGLIGALGVAAMLFFGMWVYGDVDTSFYYDLPAGILELIGIDPDGEGAGGIAFGAIFNLVGAFTLAGLAISWGASAIAGEERDGTIGLLLGNPVSRRRVLVSKSLSLVLVVFVMCAVLWVAGNLSASVLDVSTDNLFVGSITFAMLMNSLFYGFLALAIGAWTGKRAMASGVAGGVMVVGYLAASLLPLVDAERAAQFFPWYYYSASSPVYNGIDVGHMVVLGTLILLLFIAAYLGVQRRDLREGGTDVTIVDRLRAHPRTQKLIDRIAGSARVSRISAKTFSDHQVLLTVTAAIMFYMGVAIPPMYTLIPDDFINIFSTFPDALVAMIGGVDMGTPAGFLTGELFALTGPIAIIVLTSSIGSRALAGEEMAHTMGLLLSNPISRTTVVLEKTLAMIGHALAFGAATFLGTWAGVRLAGLSEVGVTGIAAVSFMLSLFGLVFGGVALALSAATGKRSATLAGTTGVALATWFIFSFFPLSETLDGWTRLSPFHWFLGNDPLLNGFDWGGVALMAIVFALLVAAAIPLFQRRDLRG